MRKHCPRRTFSQAFLFDLYGAVCPLHVCRVRYRRIGVPCLKQFSLLGQVSLLPPAAAIAASAIAGPTADALIASGWPVARVRKAAQAVAFLGPTACLAAASVTDDGATTVGAHDSSNRAGVCHAACLPFDTVAMSAKMSLSAASSSQASGCDFSRCL